MHWTESIMLPDALGRIHLGEVASTNQFGLQLETLTQPTAIFAASQTAGRGRRGNEWVSGIADNLYCTLAFDLPQYSERYRLLAIIAATTIINTLRHHNLAVNIKWPNDIYIDDGKAGGVLVDATVRGQAARIALGFGLNWVSPGAQLLGDRRTAALLSSDSAALAARSKITASLISELYQSVIQPALAGTLNNQLIWPAFDQLAGKQLNIRFHDDKMACGVYAGVSKEGELRLRNESDEIALICVDQVANVGFDAL